VQHLARMVQHAQMLPVFCKSLVMEDTQMGGIRDDLKR
jgi:hypothetical protein